jgi:tryptophan halogenase
MALFEQNAIAYQDSDDLFRVDSWVQVLMGQGMRPRAHNPLARLAPPDQLKRALGDLQGNVARSVAALPPHADFLNRYCAAEAA